MFAIQPFTNKKPIANSLVVFREEFDDWAVLFNPETAAAVGINPIGVAIWKSLDGHSDVEDIAYTIRDRFSAVPKNVHQEVTQFVTTLYEHGFVGYEMEAP